MELYKWTICDQQKSFAFVFAFRKFLESIQTPAYMKWYLQICRCFWLLTLWFFCREIDGNVSFHKIYFKFNCFYLKMSKFRYLLLRYLLLHNLQKFVLSWWSFYYYLPLKTTIENLEKYMFSGTFSEKTSLMFCEFAQLTVFTHHRCFIEL